MNFSRLHVHNFNCDLLKSTFCDLLSLCTQRFNYEDLYFHVITLCSSEVTVNFWAKDFQPPGKNGPYAYDGIRLLGLIFDRHLTWSSRVNYIADKCFKSLNVLRCVSGTAWGCDKCTLLVLYRAYISSCMEYGCQAFENAAPSVLQKLAVVQSSALRFCTGALRSTPVSVLQAACNEPPLFLRRRELIYVTVSKISSDSDHPASGVLEHTSVQQTGAFKHRSPFDTVAQDFCNNVVGSERLCKTITDVPEWHFVSPNVDLSLSLCLSKSLSPVVLKSRTIEHLTKWNNFLYLFTDGSKTTSSTSAAFVVPKLNIEQAFKLNQVSICSAETAESSDCRAVFDC